jgi:glutamine amidotransferase
MNVAIIKYNAGNVQSVLNALQRIGVNAFVTYNADEISAADKVIFPGVGEASSAMQFLVEKQLDKTIISLTQPVLGICLGMQLMCSFSEEGNTKCLGIFPQKVKLFPANQKVPQMGWNNIFHLKSKIFEGLNENDYMYFVHSFYAEKGGFMIATTHYQFDYASALQKDNFYAVQFHPEKSGDAGQKILQNFVNL